MYVEKHDGQLTIDHVSKEEDLHKYDYSIVIDTYTDTLLRIIVGVKS